jgi:hypothetical protein
VSADLWFDTDISAATPTRSWIFFSRDSGALELGGGFLGGANIFMAPNISGIEDDDDDASSSARSINMQISSTVPIPATVWLLGTALASLGGRRWIKKETI